MSLISCRGRKNLPLVLPCTPPDGAKETDPGTACSTSAGLGTANAPSALTSVQESGLDEYTADHMARYARHPIRTIGADGAEDDDGGVRGSLPLDPVAFLALGAEWVAGH